MGIIEGNGGQGSCTLGCGAEIPRLVFESFVLQKPVCESVSVLHQVSDQPIPVLHEGACESVLVLHEGACESVLVLPEGACESILVLDKVACKETSLCWRS